jgi:uncharacterized protein (TIGR01777 family)
MPERVFLTGGSGWIGTALVRALRGRGDTAVVLTRDPDRAREAFARALGSLDGVELVAGDPLEAGPWSAAVAGATAAVNLAGESIAGHRWDAQQKQRIHDSRIDSTGHLVAAIAALPTAARPRVLVSASAIDYYPFAVDLGEATLGFDADDEITEAAPPSDSFLGRVCRDWEAEANQARGLGLRVVLLRTGLVLGPGGGALSRLALPFRFFVGGPLGSGRQWVSWVHLDDVVAAYLFAIDTPTLSGPCNLVAPTPERNRAFSRAVGHALHRPSWLPVPAFALHAAAGELADYLLDGRRAVPQALLAAGFQFRHPQLDEALRAP